MLEQNKKIITAHLDGKGEDKLNALRDLISTPEDELFYKSEFNFSSTGLRYKPCNRKDIDISKSELIENSFTMFSKYYNNITIEEFNELKHELIKLPFESYPVVFLFEELYIDYGVYHILHYIKDTKYVIEHIDDKKRYFYSTYKTKVLNEQLKKMESIKTDMFLYPKQDFDIDVLDTKEKLLKYANENYNAIFTWSSFFANLNTSGMFKDEVIDTVMEDFKNNMNAIKTTKKEAVKSLAILLFNMYIHTIEDNEEYELIIENILRVCFSNEIREINKNKHIQEEYLDTFKITSKEYKKNSYISSVFDGINIFGINDENKYFYFYKMSSEEVIHLYSIWTQQVMQDKKEFSLEDTYDNFIYKSLENPHKPIYTRQYPEFFENQNINILDQMATIFQEMKKSAPDNLLQKD